MGRGDDGGADGYAGDYAGAAIDRSFACIATDVADRAVRTDGGEVAVLLRVAPTATEAEVGVAKVRVGVGSGVVKVLTLE